MKLKRILLAVMTAIIALTALGSFVACGSTNTVAATVNDREIKESKVEDYFKLLLSSYGYDSFDTMASYLSMYGMSMESMRSSILDVFAEDKAVEIAADLKGITINDQEVKDQIEKTKQNFKSEDAWKESLKKSGMSSEEDYKYKLEIDMKKKKLGEVIANETTVTDELVEQYAKVFSEKYKKAKKSSHILFSSEDKDKAQEVLDKINSGNLDFSEAAKEYSTDTASAEEGGNVGWDCDNSFVEAYTSALSGLEKDQVSGLVTSDYGIHIIKCTDSFELKDEYKSISQFPEEFQKSIKSKVESMVSSSADIDSWVTTFTSGLKIVKNPMPEKASYNIASSVTVDNSSSSTTASDNSSSSTEGN